MSVRNLSEAALVSNFGVDILDFKEPSDGALAPVSVSTLNEAASWASRNASRYASRYNGQQSGTEIRLSAALGESDQACHLAASVPHAFSFAKAGPSHLNSQATLQSHWRQLQTLLPESVELVAVAYADHESARTLSPEKVLDAAIDFGLSRILIDTFGKESGSAVDLLGERRLARFGGRAHQAKRWWSLAGSINLSTVARMREQHNAMQLMSLPDCVAVRGAVCEGSREEDVCQDRLQDWVKMRNAED